MNLAGRLTLMFMCTLVARAAFAASPMRIVLAPDATEPARFAAQELGRYIAEASGVSADVSEDAKCVEPCAVFLLASGAVFPDSPRMPASADEEAYRIYSTGGGRAFVARSPRAVLYAVYDFLEEELGYRWYFPAPEDAVTPHVSADELTAIMQRDVDREERPAFPFREREFRDVMPMTEQTDARIIEQIDWWAKLRMNRFLLNFGYASNRELWQRWKTTLIPEIKRRGMLVGLGEHGSYPLFLPAARYAAEHPEWYCEIDGERVGSKPGMQFCTTNAEAVATYLENFAAFVRENPEVAFYYPAPNDCGKWCECAKCRQQSVADRYMALDNQIAEMLERVKPGTRVMHLAYSNHRLPPENVAPHPMIDVDVACWGRNFAYSLGDPRTMPGNDDYLNVFRQWADRCRGVQGDVRPRLFYHCKLMRHYWLGLHLQPLPILDEDFADAQELRLDGFDFPLGFLGIWTKGLNSYVVARKCWTPDVAAARWIDRFYADYYGDNADKARAVYGLVEEAFHDKQYGSSLALAWHPEMISVRTNPREGLGEHARNAVAKLTEALAIAEACAEGDDESARRFGKLATVLKNALAEQQVLVRLDALMQAYHRYNVAESDDERKQYLRAAQEAYEAAKAANDSLAKAYCVEDDLAGLYWAGETHKSMGRALDRWGEAVTGVDWHDLGRWETADFQAANEAITKTFDVTPYIAGADGPRVKIRVRFVYESGQLGATLKAVSLWKRGADGAETQVCEDRHGGFAGYAHENAVYFLDADVDAGSGAHYFVKAELLPYATWGTVSERGCNGKILIGTATEDSAAQ